MPCCFISTFAKSQFPLPRPNQTFFIKFALNANTAKFMLILPPHDPDLENLCYLLQLNIFLRTRAVWNSMKLFQFCSKPNSKSRLKLSKVKKIEKYIHLFWRLRKYQNNFTIFFGLFRKHDLYFCFIQYFLGCTRVFI